MKRLNTMISYDKLFSLAKRGGKARGHPTFIKLLRPALLELSDYEIEILVRSTAFWFGYKTFSNTKFEAMHILIIQEYVKRVEKTAKEEREAAERLEKLKGEVRKEEWYTKIKTEIEDSYLEQAELEKLVHLKAESNLKPLKEDWELTQDVGAALRFQTALHSFNLRQDQKKALNNTRSSYPFDQVQEDQYSSYSVERFREEIEFLGKRSLEASLEGNREGAALLNKQASELTQRMLELQKKIKYAQAYRMSGNVLSDLISGAYYDTFVMDDLVSSNNVITLKMVKETIERLAGIKPKEKKEKK